MEQDIETTSVRPSHAAPWWPVWTTLPPGQKNHVRIQHFRVDEALSAAEKQRAPSDPYHDVPPGTYAALTIREPSGVEKCYMSDVPGELDSCLPLIEHAHGRICIAGLGLGAVLWPLMDNYAVTRITVLERHQEVIDLVSPSLQYHERSRIIQIEHADVWAWRPSQGMKYNTIYFDIWPDRVAENLPEIARLHKRGWRWLDQGDPDRWMGSWYQRELQLKRRRERRYIRDLRRMLNVAFARYGGQAPQELLRQMDNFDTASIEQLKQKLGAMQVCAIPEWVG